MGWYFLGGATSSSTGTTSSTFTIDTDGASPVMLKNNAGVLEIRNGGDTDYVDLIVANLTVDGIITSIDIEEIHLEDSVIILNFGATGSPTQNAGLEVARGTESNSSLLWDESNDLWKAGIKGSEKTIILEGSAATLGIISTPQVQAVDSNGLKLYEDGGAGLFVQDATGYLGINCTNPVSGFCLEGTTSLAGTAKIEVRANTATDAPYLVLARTRGDFTTPAFNQSGDYISVIASSVWNGTTDQIVEGILCQATELHSAAGLGVAQRFYSVPNGATSIVHRMTIDQSGNIGIGTGQTTPAEKLVVDGNVNVTTGNEYLVNGTSINAGGTLTNVAYLDQGNTFTNLGTTSFAASTFGLRRTNPQTRFEVSAIQNAPNQNNGIRLSTDGALGTSAYRYVDFKFKSDATGSFRLGLDVENNDSAPNAIESMSIRTTTGYIGLGNTDPDHRLWVAGPDSSAGDILPLAIGWGAGATIGTPQACGILFGKTNDNQHGKGAIFFERNQSSIRGDMVIALSNDSADVETSMSDEKWRFKLDGSLLSNVGNFIGRTATDDNMAIGGGTSGVTTSGALVQTFGNTHSSLAGNIRLFLGTNGDSLGMYRADGALSVDMDGDGVVDFSYDVNANAVLTTNGRTLDYANKTADYTTTATDHVISVTTSTVAVTITLDSAVAVAGTTYVIKDTGNAANFNVIVAPNNSKTIDGQTSLTISTNYDKLTVIYDGTNWLTI